MRVLYENTNLAHSIFKKSNNVKQSPIDSTKAASEANSYSAIISMTQRDINNNASKIKRILTSGSLNSDNMKDIGSLYGKIIDDMRLIKQNLNLLYKAKSMIQ